MEKKLRADTQKTRDRLLDAVGALTETKGLDFSLPDVARHAGVSVATAYRHFDALQELRLEFYHRSLSALISELHVLLLGDQGFRLFETVCARILEHYQIWARPASILRSPRGWLERLHDGDPLVTQFHGLLDRVLTNLIDLGIVPSQARDVALLIWATIFDERVYLDFRYGKGFSHRQTTTVMTATVLNSLRNPVVSSDEGFDGAPPLN